MEDATNSLVNERLSHLANFVNIWKSLCGLAESNVYGVFLGTDHNNTLCYIVFMLLQGITIWIQEDRLYIAVRIYHKNNIFVTEKQFSRDAWEHVQNDQCALLNN